MHAHFSKPVNAFDPDQVEWGLHFQRKPRSTWRAPLIAAAGVGCGRCANLVGLQLQTSFDESEAG